MLHQSALRLVADQPIVAQSIMASSPALTLLTMAEQTVWLLLLQARVALKIPAPWLMEANSATPLLVLAAIQDCCPMVALKTLMLLQPGVQAVQLVALLISTLQSLIQAKTLIKLLILAVTGAGKSAQAE